MVNNETLESLIDKSIKRAEHYFQENPDLLEVEEDIRDTISEVAYGITRGLDFKNMIEILSAIGQECYYIPVTLHKREKCNLYNVAYKQLSIILEDHLLDYFLDILVEFN